MFDYILFDLDGTLTDPKEGITKSVQYALKAFDIEETNLDKLEPFIGPPLKDSFMEFYGFSIEQTQKSVEKYRDKLFTPPLLKIFIFYLYINCIKTFYSKNPVPVFCCFWFFCAPRFVLVF